MKMLYIVGPTASGKTSLAVNIAKHMNGEIIAADSRTVYKGMDIGTAKPSLVEQAGIRHHCLDIADPDDNFTVTDFVSCAKEAILKIEVQGKLPIVVGGSGLFVNSLLYGYTFTPPNSEARIKYQDYTIEQLQKEIIGQGLQLPENNKNKRYLQATLERRGIQPISQELAEGTVIIGLDIPKDELRQRVNNRAKDMIESGLKNEAIELFNKYDTNLNAFNGGIYKLIPGYINDEISEQDLIEQVVKSDMKLAKKQMTWFRRNREILWFDSPDFAYNWLLRQTSDTIN